MLIDVVLKYIQDKKLSKYAFEQAVGLSNAYLANIKKTGSEIQPDKLKLILEKYPDLENYLESNTPSDGAPLISHEAAAGFGTAIFAIKDEDIMGRYVVPDFTNIDFMIRVKGSSMYPKYSSGDIVACRIIRESRFIQWNKPYIIATKEQGLLCKRLRQSEKKNHILAISDNKDYPPFDIPSNEITGIALIVGTIRLE